MKKVLMLMAVAMLVTPAMAVMTLTMTNPNSGAPYVYTPTGQAQADWSPFGKLLGTGYNTFCLELFDGFFPTVSYFATVDPVVKYPDAFSGQGNNSVNWPLVQRTKEIYAAYLNGALGSFTALQVQNAIYKNQGFSGYSDVLGVLSNTTGWQAVKALNLWTSYNATTGVYSGDAQSQVIMTPAPGALLLGSLGMGLVGWLRRRQTA